MKSPAIAFLSALLGAFLAGVGVYQYMDGLIDTRVGGLRQLVESAHSRLDKAALHYGPPEHGDRFVAQAGDERKSNDEGGKEGRTERHVMIGQWDGTGTTGANAGWSRNFYRELTLVVPPRQP